MKHLAVPVFAFITLLLALRGAKATFDASNGRDPNTFDLTTILECAVDGGVPLNVPLVPRFVNVTDNDFWLPETSGVKFPESLNWISNNYDALVQLVAVLQDIDITLQSLADSTQAIPDNICNSTEIGFDKDNASYIVDVLLSQGVRSTNISGLIFSSDQINSTGDEITRIRNVFRTLECKVFHDWNDLGPTYLPRFNVGGRCINRMCGFPARNGQICRPDVSQERNFFRLPGIRWDCCWEFVDDQHSYNCGWRRVSIPILCDCDCDCPRLR